MNFSKALSLLKAGERVYRKGWNGKGMFVVYQKGYPEGIPSNKQTADAWGHNEGDLFKCEPYLQIKNAQGSHSMWVPSIGDLLAEDWSVMLPRRSSVEDMKEQKIVQIARLCHNVNKAYCKSIGDYAHPTWEDADQWQKESAINGVRFHLSHDREPYESHENWMKEKLEDGWVYGEIKDPVAKTHPCLVPYHELPTQQRTKDFIFKAIVDSFKN